MITKEYGANSCLQNEIRFPIVLDFFYQIFLQKCNVRNDEQMCLDVISMSRLMWRTAYQDMARFSKFLNILLLITLSNTYLMHQNLSRD